MQISQNKSKSICDNWNMFFGYSKKIVKYFLVIGICLLIIPQSVSAQDVAIVVSPPRFDIEGKPGEVIQKNIKITNNDNERELILKAFPVDFIVQDDQGTPIKVSESASGRYLSSPWFSLEKSEIVIPPKVTEQIVVIITIPKDALPGGHYTGVFFEPLLSRGQKSTVSYTSSQVGSLFGITVAGDIKYDAMIKEFSTKARLAEFGPIEFTTKIENQSDTHIRPNSTIEIHDMLGRKLESLKLDEVNIFPFTSRTLKNTWETVWGLGRYTATLTIVYGPDLNISRTLYFWILPYRLIAAILVVLMVVIVATILIHRHMKHREDHRDQEIDELKRKIVEMENNLH